MARSKKTKTHTKTPRPQHYLVSPYSPGGELLSPVSEKPVDLRAVLMYWGPLVVAIFSAGVLWSRTEAQIAQLNQQRSELKGQVTELEGRVRKAEFDLADQQKRVVAIETKLDPVIIRLDRVERKLDMLICKILPKECKTLTSE